MNKKLIVGLGNVGDEYCNTRHNIGFKLLDALALEEGFSFQPDKFGSIATHRIRGRFVLFLKPSTYVNKSGRAVKYWMDRHKILQENVLIVVDDLNLPFGSIRLRGSGSDGGHNGLKDIQQYLGKKYPRFRFGIGAEYIKGKQVAFVLEQWNAEEKEQLPERITQGVALIKSFVFTGLENTMNSFNSK